MSADNLRISNRSIEHLHHFSCGLCQKWWTVADAPAGKSTWFCPWCGSEQSFAKAGGINPTAAAIEATPDAKAPTSLL